MSLPQLLLGAFLLLLEHFNRHGIGEIGLNQFLLVPLELLNPVLLGRDMLS